RRHHADHGEGLIIEPDDFANDGGIRAEMTLPEAVTENDDFISAEPVFFRRKGTASERLNAKQREEAGGNTRRLDSLRLALPGQVQALVGEGRDVGEDFVP